MKKLVLVIAIILLVSLVAIFILRGETKRDNTDLKTEITNAFVQKYNRPADVFIIETKIDTGSFAKGTVNFKDEAGGGLWFAAKTDKGWELAFDGNGIISCEIVNKYNFPVGIISGCIDTQNNDKFIQR